MIRSGRRRERALVEALDLSRQAIEELGSIVASELATREALAAELDEALGLLERCRRNANYPTTVLRDVERFLAKAEA